MIVKKYKRTADYSYTLGMTLTIELIQKRTDCVSNIYVHPDYENRNSSETIFDICRKYGVPYETNVKVFNRLATKENTFVLGVFDKYDEPVSEKEPHVVLVNPSDAGNLGTIIRTGVGFGFRDFVMIRPGVDIFDPRTIRASMGAFFHCHFTYFDSFEEYMEKFSEHKLYPFMLDGQTTLSEIKGRPDTLFSLVFGNEATGLPESFREYGESVYIQHNNEIDSLNLSIAFGIAAHTFSERN